MGVFTRPDSPYYWLWLERRGKKGVREKTEFLKTPENRQLAEQFYQQRMQELAVGRSRQTHTVRQRDRWCSIYFASDGEFVKIGRAVNLRARFRAMQTSHPRRFVVLATFSGHPSLERLVHRRFRHCRIGTATEWFRLDAELQAFIDRIASGIDPTPELLNSLPTHNQGEAKVFGNARENA